MNYYESALLFDPNLDEDGLEQAVEKTSQFITKYKGEILDIDRWGKRSLAYEINKFSRAYYVLINFKCAPQSVKSIERQYKLSEPIIRYITVNAYSTNPQTEPISAPSEEEE